MPQEMLLFIPTYNESQNIGPLYEAIKSLNLACDILLLDDNSPDGTGKIMDQIAAGDPSVSVIHREGKLGIGSAHKVGIRWAHQHGYKILLTMDADFTHNPEKLRDLIEVAGKGDLIVASRYLQEESLPGWNPIRRFLTNLAHFLLINLVGLRNDATGALRLYRLDRIPVTFLDHVRSDGYAFFFESMFVMVSGGVKVFEIPIALSSRTYGSSKMTIKEIFKSVRMLLVLWSRHLFQKNPWKASAPVRVKTT